MPANASDPPNSDLEKARRLHQAQRLSEAAALYDRVLKNQPDNAAALDLCGVVRCQLGELTEGIALLQRSVGIARTSSAYRNLGLAYQTVGDIERAIASYREARDLDGNNPEIRLDLADALREGRRFADALAELRVAVDLKPDFAEAHRALGQLLSELTRNPEANAASGVTRPHLAEAHFGLARSLLRTLQLEQAATEYAAGLALGLPSPAIHAEFGALLQELQRPDEAREAFRAAYKDSPTSLASQWSLATCHLQPVYRSERDVDAARAGYERELLAMASRQDLGGREQLLQAADAFGRRLPFYLPGQGHNDRELQKAYGSLVCRTMQACLPQFADRPTLTSPGAGEKIRVGIASGFMCRHSVWKIPIRGWIENLDRDRFALHGYFLDTISDEVTEQARRHFVEFHADARPVAAWADLIRRHRLHILIYPEIGMHDTALQLAALRLAPVQALSLGHPETSGLPSIDHFLSSEFMEPPGVEAHYTERLVRLPNLGIHYAPPPVTPAALTRRDVGLRPEAPVYWCCQALHKYQPQHDDIFPRIAKRVKDCQFVFLRHANGAGVNAVFEERLEDAFAGYGLSMQDHCVFLPQLDFAHFNGVARLCDVYLDSIGWSGFNSLLETLVWDIPPVILPGALMRGRHSAAVMTMIGLSDLLAADLDAYVGLAARLGSDPALRQTVSARIRENKHKALGDMAAVRGLEDFIVGAVKQSQGQA